MAPFSLLIPVFGMLLSALLLGERFAVTDFAAAALVLTGLVVAMSQDKSTSRIGC